MNEMRKNKYNEELFISPSVLFSESPNSGGAKTPSDSRGSNGASDLLTNSLVASSDKTAPIVSHIVRIESGPIQFSGVELSGPASPIGEAALAGEDAISTIRN